MSHQKARDDNAKRIWVDTDFGFDDLWALLLLKHVDVTVDGVSLVSGNTRLPQVSQNAEASIRAFGLEWPVFAGAEKPLQREPETAEHILGKLGMRSRGQFLPYLEPRTTDHMQPASAIDAMAKWLNKGVQHHILALGPLTNLSLLLLQHPEAAIKIRQITWMGGSCGRGNHSPYAEYNALADPEALSVVANSTIPFKMIDLELCRQVCFSEADIPSMRGANQHLLADLLGGYLDIALQRGRTTMSIYDPLAALAVVQPDLFEFASGTLNVKLDEGAEYGRTVVDATANLSTSNFECAVSVHSEKARQFCLSTLIDA